MRPAAHMPLAERITHGSVARRAMGLSTEIGRSGSWPAFLSWCRK
jgi:hypothetical protein